MLMASDSFPGTTTIVQSAAERGVTIAGAMVEQLGLADETPQQTKVWRWTWSILSAASAAASTYHGYRRHGTVGAAIGWGLLGALFPIITPAVALAQGFGKRK